MEITAGSDVIEVISCSGKLEPKNSYHLLNALAQCMTLLEYQIEAKRVYKC